MNVPREILNKAYTAYINVVRGKSPYTGFRQYFGLTSKQWTTYLHTGKLHVTKEAYLKMQITIAADRAMPEYRPAMIKAMEAKFGNGVKQKRE